MVNWPCLFYVLTYLVLLLPTLLILEPKLFIFLLPALLLLLPALLLLLPALLLLLPALLLLPSICAALHVCEESDAARSPCQARDTVSPYVYVQQYPVRQRPFNKNSRIIHRIRLNGDTRKLLLQQPNYPGRSLTWGPRLDCQSCDSVFLSGSRENRFQSYKEIFLSFPAFKSKSWKARKWRRPVKSPTLSCPKAL